MQKKHLLHYIIACTLIALLWTAPLHAAEQQPQAEPALYDYTLKHHPNISNEVTSLDDLADIPLELQALTKTANSNPNTNVQANLLALVLKHK